ncbi:hypothetical protein ZWY2020_035239 [Hordeum vulgare]|nr:hypothetical protein ZWY2020_035239 [Hordeum vulgare]
MAAPLHAPSTAAAPAKNTQTNADAGETAAAAAAAAVALPPSAGGGGLFVPGLALAVARDAWDFGGPRSSSSSTGSGWCSTHGKQRGVTGVDVACSTDFLRARRCTATGLGSSCGTLCTSCSTTAEAAR